ncbi:MAG: hypothetical protein ACTSW1_15615 [Candidatus Hodarchaeales archaeon]
MLTISARVDDRLYGIIEKIRERTGASRTSIIVKLIENGLKHSEGLEEEIKKDFDIQQMLKNRKKNAEIQRTLLKIGHNNDNFRQVVKKINSMSIPSSKRRKLIEAAMKYNKKDSADFDKLFEYLMESDEKKLSRDEKYFRWLISGVCRGCIMEKSVETCKQCKRWNSNISEYRKETGNFVRRSKLGKNRC